MLGEIFGGCGLGLLLGMRHALEPDHLAAVSTLVTSARRPASVLSLGAWWGLGHTLALLAVGGALASLRVAMSDNMADAFELVVAVMLLVLGARSLWRALRGGDGPRHAHEHGGHHHEHGGEPRHFHIAGVTVAARPLVVGLVHGLAGSGALTALALAHMPTVATAMVYMGLFGVGSMAGMAAITGVAGAALARVAARQGARVALAGASGAVAVVMGLAWGWPIVARMVARA